MNTPQVTIANTVATAHYGYVADASELGLAPGEWPELLTTDLGNGRPLILSGVWPDGQHTYKQESGCLSILVFND